MSVIDLKKGEQDAWGDDILRFYALQPPEYAVYQTSERVTVQYADAIARADEQRKSLVQLAPLRGEINGLLQNWREASDTRHFLGFIPIRNGAKLRERADRYDRRMGDALVVALEGDLTGAGDVIKTIKDDILDERIGWASLEYIVCALAVATAFILLAVLVGWLALAHDCSEGHMPLCLPQATDLWRGAMAGALGAFFSIALGISSRTVLTDLHRTSNLTDASLRVAIGIIAGAVLVALLLDGFVVIKIGDSMPISANALYIVIAGFLGGFSERMVPDLLASAVAKTGTAPIVRTPIRDAPPVTTAQGAAIVGKAAAPVGAEDSTADTDPSQAQEDCCAASLELSEDELTPDEALPAASGGLVMDQPSSDGAGEGPP